MPRKSKTVDAKWIRNDSDREAIKQGCYFDQAAVDHVLNFFAKFLRQSKGRWAGKPFKPLPWQIDLIHRLYGWKLKDGFRRFSFCYVEIPKKNGKTTLLAALALYHLIADGENGAECMVLAATRSQAKILFNESYHMVRQSPELSAVTEYSKGEKRIEYPRALGYLQAVSSDVDSKDGFNLSFVCIDELHRQKKPDLFNIVRYAGISRDQPLMFCITTAGSSKNSICWQQHETATAIIESKIIDITYLPVIYAAAPGDDLEDPKIWRKANPSMGETMKESDFANLLKAAKQSLIEWYNFLRLRFGIWTTSDFRFINMVKWSLCNQGPIDLERLKGQTCYAGCDLSATKDTTSIVLIFEDGTILPYFWIPESQLDSHPEYRGWQEKGFLTATPGEVIDYRIILKKLEQLSDQFYIAELAIDPYNATQFIVEADTFGINIKKLRNNMLTMNAPTKELERLVLSTTINHGGHPVLAWQAENAVASMDRQGNCMITKETRASKIDGMVALTMAVHARVENTVF